MITGHLSGETITSNTQEAFSIHEKSSYGEKQGGLIQYATVEALFLVMHTKMQILQGKKELSFTQLLQKVKKRDKKIETKLAVYADLRKRGYVLKTALKFGADFRVYNKGVKPGQDHARWILYTTEQNDKIDWNDFAAKNRIAHSTKKKLLIGVVDEERSVSYYDVAWLKP